MKLSFQPVESRSNIVNFTNAVVMLALAQSCTPEIEAQNREPETVQRLGCVKHNFIVEGPTVEGVRVAD